MPPDLIRRREARAIGDLLRQGLRPPPRLTVSEWADLHRELPSTSAEPGRWKTRRTPYLREIMDCFSDPLIERIVFMKGSQIGGSEALLNAVGFFIDQEPTTILVVQYSDGEAEKFSKERIAPMIRDCPVLAEKVSTRRSKEGGNTIEAKEFPGGHLGIVGANAPAKLASRPRRVVVFDEVDRYPASAGREGDPMAIAEKRTSTYWNRKIGAISSPTVRGISRIEQAFEQSDQRYYLVPCPHCGHEQRLIWERVRWDKQDTPDGAISRPETAHYLCESCEERILERQKPKLLERGRWEAMNPASSIAGFHLSALYSPWFKWAELADEFLKAKNFPDRLRVFVNTRLAETFVEKGDAPEWHRLYERREAYPLGACPDGVVFLTAGVDVQKDRIEAFVWGWGYDKESWLVDHQVIEGGPDTEQPWPLLTELLHKSYRGERGLDLPITALAIDTGFSQTAVVTWARRVADRRIMLVRGENYARANWTFIVGAPSKSEVTIQGKKTGLLLWPVGGALIKQETYGFLALDQPVDGEPYPPGFIHLPMVDDEFVQQLVAEDLVTVTDRKGFTRREWQKRRHRNEALDGRVYARAAAEREGLSRLVRPTEKPAKSPEPKPEGKSGRGGAWLGGRGGPAGGRGKWLKR